MPHNQKRFTGKPPYRSRFFFRLASLCFLLLPLSFATADAAENCQADPPRIDTSEPNDYLFEREPKRVALVIGNDNYSNLSKIPSARTDGERVRDRLTALGFRMCYYSNVSSFAQFDQEVLPRFRKMLDYDDFVVVYFSGHGFGYGNDNFLVPTDMPSPISEKMVTKFAISVDGFKGVLESHKPGFLLFILDACRTIGGVVQNDQGEAVIAKGFSEMRDTRDDINSFIAYATKPGTTAGGFQVNRPSVFTDSLIKYIDAEGQPLSSVLDDAAADVRSESQGAQVPGNHDWSQTDPFLRPNDNNLNALKDAWLTALNNPTYQKVERFTFRHSVTRHTAAARKWLNKNPPGTTPEKSTLASPVAIDRAWRSDSESPVSVRRLAIPFGLDRSLELDEATNLTKFSDFEIGLVPSSMSLEDIAQLRTLSAYFPNITPTSTAAKTLYRESLAYSLATIDAHGTAVTKQNLTARTQPTTSGKVVGNVSAGTKLNIMDVVLGPRESLWIKASSVENDNAPFYLRVAAGRTPEPLALGHSLKELLVPRRPNSIPELVDSSPILQALTELRSLGWKITWVSIASAATDDKEESDLRAARIANVEYIFRRAGVDPARITSVQGREDFSSADIRVRIYGSK